MIAPLQLQPSRMRRQWLWTGYLTVLVILASMSWQPWWWQALLAIVVVYPWVAELRRPQDGRQLYWQQGHWHDASAAGACLSPRSRVSRHLALCLWQQAGKQQWGFIWRDQLSEAQWRCFARQLQLTQWQHAHQNSSLNK